LIKIGDFARLSQLSVVTLRHYDDIGLLKPVAVDASSGYRYYSVSQLPRLNRILALKDLGFSLEQIEQVLNDDLTLDQLRGMLKMKQAEVEQHLAEEQGRLSRIEARLKQIELEDAMPNYDVLLKTVPPVLIASRKITIPANNQVPAYLPKAFREVLAYVKVQGARVSSPDFAIWHQPAEVLVNEIAEAAVAVDRPLPATDRVAVYELPQTLVASVVHRGALEGFTQAHKALLGWIEANGYQTTGTYREVYVAFNHQNMAESITEIQYPVEKG
jgi:DNA-binding transcriptional MerR regulator